MNKNAFPLEADTRVLIDTALTNLGWNNNPQDPNRNVYFEQPKTEEERKRLKGKRPDYVLYSNDTGQPLIVIEAKRPGARLDAAMEQGIDYARIINAPLVFATDGVYCRSYHTGANRPPILNGEEIDEFIREALAFKYLKTYEVNTVSPRVQYDRKELIRIFDEANNMLRGEGLRAGIERFGEFANILFLKLVSENEEIKRLRGVQTKFDMACHWNSIKDIPASTRIEYINKFVYEKLNDLYRTSIFTPLQIKDIGILKDIMDKLDPLTLTDVDSDVKGDAFEYFLKASTATKNDLGEYFTPRHIVKTMVRLVNPQIGEKIYDPFCGTGGFLIESFRHIEKNMVTGNSELQEMLRERTIYGNEITNTARITKMNMILAGDGHSNIFMKDSLANPPYLDKVTYDKNGNVLRDADGNVKYSKEYCGLYDVVITNMPYSQRTKHGNLYDLPSTNGDSICVQHCIKAINSTAKNGRMALVVPEGFLFRKDMTRIREYLLDRCELQSIISLPQGVFLPYTGVKTDIIYATKVNRKVKMSEKKKYYWYFDVKNDGYSLDNHRRKLDASSDLAKYEEFRKLDEGQKADMLSVGFEVIPFDRIKGNSYILVGNRYKDFDSTNDKKNSKICHLGNVAELIRGISFPKSSQQISKTDDSIGVVTTKAAQIDGIVEDNIVYVSGQSIKEEKYLQKEDVLISLANSLDLVGRVTYVDKSYSKLSFGAFMGVIRVDRTKVYPRYLYWLLQSNKAKQFFKGVAKTTTNISNITFEDLKKTEIPLIPVEEQIKLASELDSYNSIVLGARSIINSYKPFFTIDNKWPVENLGDSCSFEYGFTGVGLNKGEVRYIRITDVSSDGFLLNDDVKYVSLTEENKKYLLFPNDVLVARIGASYGKTLLFDGRERAIFASYLIRLKLDKKILPKYYFYFSQSDYYWEQAKSLVTGAGQPQFNANTLKLIRIPVPPLVVQQEIVDQIEKDYSIVRPSMGIIDAFTEKIVTRINKIWEE